MGTTYYTDKESEPTKGRILIFGVTDSKVFILVFPLIFFLLIPHFISFFPLHFFFFFSSFLKPKSKLMEQSMIWSLLTESFSQQSTAKLSFSLGMIKKDKNSNLLRLFPLYFAFILFLLVHLFFRECQHMEIPLPFLFVQGETLL